MTERLRRALPYVGIAAVLVLIVVWVVSRQRGKPVRVTRPRRADLDFHIAASGKVEAKSADLGFETAGEITRVYVDEADPVAKSQLLARIEPAKGVPGEIGSADVIQSPYDGSVVAIYQREGAMVQPAQPVMRVVSSGGKWVTGFLDAEDATHVSPGDEFRCRAGGYLSRAWKIVVSEIGREAVERRDLPGSSPQVRVRFGVADSPFPLAAGADVDIDGRVTILQDALLIPAAAVVRRARQDFVWLVEAGKATVQPIEVGPNNFSMIQVRSGLQTDDVVVVGGKDDLSEGDPVAPEPMAPMTEATPGGP